VFIVVRPEGPTTPGILREVAAIIEHRLQAFGVTAATVSIQGSDIAIDLSPMTSLARAEEISEVVDQTGQVLFRPVDCLIAPYRPVTARNSSGLQGSQGRGIVAGASVTTPTTSLSSRVCGSNSLAQQRYPTTLPWADFAENTVVLPYYAKVGGARYVLGPAEMTGSIVKSAVASLNADNDEWQVSMSFTPDGSALFNHYAAVHYQCYVEDEVNPPDCALQAIELDGEVESAPVIEASSFDGGATINGSTTAPFTKQQAQDLALVLNYGVLPVRLVTQEVSVITPRSPTTVTTTVTGTTAPPVSVPLIRAPANVGCPRLNGSSPHYTRFSSAPPICIDTSQAYTAKMVTDVGTITIKLLTQVNPTTVNNFVFLAGYHFYDGTVFHRVCTGFVDQGGDPTGTGTGGPGYSFNGGTPKSASVYTNGALAMANSGSASTDGSQFFIVVGNTGPTTLTALYSYFGNVTGGLSVVNAINKDGSSAATTNDSCPPHVVHKIIKVTITES
jgi:cyclophilin family peptidyl-prolyl cis-trans isomerase